MLFVSSAARCPFLVAQHRDMVKAMAPAGDKITVVELPTDNHMSMLLQLGTPHDTPLPLLILSTASSSAATVGAHDRRTADHVCLGLGAGPGGSPLGQRRTAPGGGRRALLPRWPSACSLPVPAVAARPGPGGGLPLPARSAPMLPDVLHEAAASCWHRGSAERLMQPRCCRLFTTYTGLSSLSGCSGFFPVWYIAVALAIGEGRNART